MCRERIFVIDLRELRFGKNYLTSINSINDERIIVRLVAILTIMSMSVSCSKENSAGFIWLLSESGTVDYSAQDVQLVYKVIMDNGSSV